MNPENEAKKANLEQDNKVTEQLPEQDCNQNAAELNSSAPDDAPVVTEQDSEAETKTTQTIPAESAQSASSEQTVSPEGAVPQMPLPAPPSQDSFQPAAYAKETGVKPGKFASFCKKSWVKDTAGYEPATGTDGARRWKPEPFPGAKPAATTGKSKPKSAARKPGCKQLSKQQ